MPKRRKEVEYEHLLKKLRKLDKKIRQRYHSGSQECELSHPDAPRESTDSNRVAGLLDGTNSEPDGRNYAEQTSDQTERSTAISSAVHEHAVVTAISAGDLPIPGSSADSGAAEISQNTILCEDSVDNMLDDTIIELLGDDPTISNSYGTEIHKDLAVRLEHIATHGLSREGRKELTEKYLVPVNCKLIDAPALNPEMKVATSEMTTKRDKSIEFRQKQNAAAISCLSQTINKLFSYKEADASIIRMLMDAGRILCDLQHHDSNVRRSFILSSVKKEMKDQLQNTRPDKMLFGQDLSETLKVAKAISKSGADLKVPAPRLSQSASKKPQAATSSSKNLNWKGPYPPRKQPFQNNPKTKEPPPPQNRSRPYNSSRPSQQQQTRGRR